MKFTASAISLAILAFTMSPDSVYSYNSGLRGLKDSGSSGNYKVCGGSFGNYKVCGGLDEESSYVIETQKGLDNNSPSIIPSPPGDGILVKTSNGNWVSDLYLPGSAEGMADNGEFQLEVDSTYGVNVRSVWNYDVDEEIPLLVEKGTAVILRRKDGVWYMPAKLTEKGCLDYPECLKYSFDSDSPAGSWAIISDDSYVSNIFA